MHAQVTKKKKLSRTPNVTHTIHPTHPTRHTRHTRHTQAVIRIKATTPGIYQLHCHMEHHIATGMMLALNILPSQQPPIPDDVPTDGPCPVWSRTNSSTGVSVAGLTNHQLVKENEDLRDQVRALQDKLELQELRHQAQCK